MLSTYILWWSFGVVVMTTAKLIPGAFEPRPLRPRPGGSMGGPASGAGNTTPGPRPMDATTIGAHTKEGGGCS